MRESIEDPLGEVVRLVANEMVAEVCSIYLLRAGEVLELFATQGLNPSAVHRTRLRVGEGLVGDIAAHNRPLSLADAQSHPQYAYRPETGEEIYHSLAGVPIVRAGRVLGVLVVQNRTRRHYDEEEIETLQTIAMVLAELIAAGHFVSPNEMQQVDGLGLLPLRVDGVQLTPGVAIGHAVLHEPRISIQKVVAEDIGLELKRFEEAAHGVREDVDRMLEAHDMQSGEQREILETFRMFVDDRGWLERIREAIGSGLTAEAGVQRGFDDVRARLGQSTDPYIRERLSDLQDLTNRVLLRLTGRAAIDPASLPDDMIIIARDMGPAELLDYDRTRLRGLVLEEGSAMSHVAIVARALDIPVVGRAPDVLSARRAGRFHRGRRRQRPGPGAAGRRHPADHPCRDRGARRAPAQVHGAARAAVGDARSGAHLAAHECRSIDRHAASRRDRRRWRRPVPDRDPVHGAFGVSRRRCADLALQPRARRRRWTAGDFPHARCRWRQGAALCRRLR